MPVVGQPAHTHFTPAFSAVALERISLSVTYLYNISAASYRVSLARTYVYNLKVIVSRSQVYLYNVNPVTPIGPTRLYFHAALNPLPNLPNMCLCVLVPNKVVDAETVNRTMGPIVSGTGQSTLTLTSNGTTAPQVYYFSRFVTDTFTQVSSIQAKTWTYNFATNTSNPNSKFPVNGTNKPVRVVAYVWRPSTQSKVGDIIDANTASTVDFNTAESVSQTTFSGNQVLNVHDGDVLCFEAIFEITQSSTAVCTDRFFYDGTTVNTTKNAAVTNHASFLETPQGLAFGAALTRVSKPCIQKYNIIGRLSPGLSQTYKYSLNSLVSLAPVYKYAITTATSLSQIYLYSLTGRLSIPSINKYNILVKISAPKIFRYVLNSRLAFSRIYQYNINSRISAPLSIIYKYNLLTRLSFSQIYKYNLTILAPVSLSTIYKYNLVSRTLLSNIYQYYILTRVTKKAIVFDGVDDSIALGNNSTLNNLENFTITCWIYPTSNSSGSTPHIFVKRYPSNNGFLLYFSSNNFTLNWRTVNNSAVNVVSTSNYIDLNGASKWYHIAVTFNRSTGLQQLAINAVIRDSDTNTGLTANQVGSTDNMSINGGSVHWAGRFRDFRLFRQELSQSDINKIYVDDPTAPVPNYWLKTEEGVGNPKDSISGTFTGTLQNGASWLTYESGLLRKYLYSLTTSVPTLSRIYRYPILSQASLNRVYRYNVLIRAILSRSYRYILVALAQKLQHYNYNLIQRLSAARIFRYRIGEGISLIRRYLYRINARTSFSSTYLYDLIGVVSPIIWTLTGQTTDFPGKLEDLVKDYVIARWSIIEPSLGSTAIITSTSSPKQQAQIDNFDYDSYRTYYLKINEVKSNVTTRRIRFNTYQFETPIEIEYTSRRLKKGEAYNELNNIINELMRIFGTYQKEEIFGIQGITFDGISPVQKELPTPGQTVWVKRLRIILHYYKTSLIG